MAPPQNEPNSKAHTLWEKWGFLAAIASAGIALATFLFKPFLFGQGVAPPNEQVKQADKPNPLPIQNVVVTGQSNSFKGSITGSNINTGFINGSGVQALNVTGIVVGGNSNVVLVNVWSGDTKYTFHGDGKFPFPVDGPAKMNELRELSQTDAFKIAMRPFAAKGRLQPDNAGNLVSDKDTIAKPVSYSRLLDCGALNTDTAGQERLVKVAIGQADQMRPRWQMRFWRSNFWIQDNKQVQMIQKSQDWINNYHNEMVAIGILSE